MRRILTVITLVVCQTANAQQTLPDRFFVECKKIYHSDVLVLVDRTKKTFFIKTPFLREIHLTKHCMRPAQAVFRYECIVKCNHLQ